MSSWRRLLVEFLEINLTFLVFVLLLSLVALFLEFLGIDMWKIVAGILLLLGILSLVSNFVSSFLDIPLHLLDFIPAPFKLPRHNASIFLEENNRLCHIFHGDELQKDKDVSRWDGGEDFGFLGEKEEDEREKYLTAKCVKCERRYNMGLFGDKEELEELRANFEELQQENESLREQIRVYERDRDNFRELKIVADRLTAENKALLSKIETFNTEKERIVSNINAQKSGHEEEIARMRGIIDQKEKEISELNNQITLKKDEIAAKLFAIYSKNTDINLPDGLTLSGGLKSERNVVVGNDVVVKGDIESEETVSLGSRSAVLGTIRAKNIVSKESCEFRGDIYATDKIVLGDKTILNKDMRCDGSIKIGSHIEMKDDFHTRGDIQTGTNCTFKRLVSDGEVVLGQGSKVEYIIAGGNLELMDGVIVYQGIEYGGQMKIGKDVRIEGMIKARSGHV